MSRFSGKCDLFDHISGRGGWYDKDGNPVKFGQEGVSVYYSDEMQDFIAFKKETGGVIHQHKKVKVDEWNQDEVAKHCKFFKVIPHEEIIKDKRYNGGERKQTTYTYSYYGKEYTLKELNKHGVWVEIDIHFNTILDLIPYYPYIVACAAYNDGKAYIVISGESYVTEERDGHIEHGYFSDFWEHYAKELQDHYREIVLTYFNPEGRERVKEITFDKNGLGYVGEPIDYNFDPDWRWEDGKRHDHWTSPKLVDAEKGCIKISDEDQRHYIGNKALVYYVTTKNAKLYLG